jgi:hypothetical protein
MMVLVQGRACGGCHGWENAARRPNSHDGQTKLVNSLALRRRTDEIGQFTGTFVDGQT